MDETFADLIAKADRHAFLVSVWLCGNAQHGECWTSDHITTQEVRADIAWHTDDCECWRHAILAEADAVRQERFMAGRGKTDAVRQR